MNLRQQAMYWAEWGRLRDVLKARGKSWAEIEEHRRKVTRRALGIEKSSKLFTNADLDLVLARIRSELEPDNLDAQLALQENPEKRRDGLLKRCDQCCDRMWSLGCDMRMMHRESRDGYVRGTARNVIGKPLEKCNEVELAKILGCLEARLKRLVERVKERHAAAARNSGNPF